MDDFAKVTLRILIEALLALVLVYSPIAFGSAAAVYRPILWILSALLFILTLVYRTRFARQQPVGREKKTYQSPLLSFWLFGLYAAYLLVYLIPVPASIGTMILGASEIPNSAMRAIHPHPEQGLRAALDWISAFSVFYTVTMFPDSRMQIRRIVYVILAVAGFEAVYGIVEFASGHQHIFNYAKIAYLESATGTFVNRNHFANYLAMALCLSIGVILFLWSRSDRSRSGKKAPIEMALLVAFFAIFLGAALLLSRSRAGLLCAAISLVGFGVYSIQNRKSIYFLFVAGLLILGIGFSFWIGKNPNPDRFLDLSAQMQSADARPAVWKRSAALWLDAPVIGRGASTFADAFETSANGSISARYRHAHNDYLETLVETGLAGFLLLFGGIAATLWSTILCIQSRKSRFARFYSQAMVAAAAAFLLHSFVDFSMQIPANRLLFFTILGLGYCSAARRMTR
jgi:O-antigen ligase